MAKIYAIIGYAETSETSPGIWEDIITERGYYGDIQRASVIYNSSDTLNDDISISNDLSILSDTFANEKIHLMRYAKIGDIKWKISKVEIIYPRLKLTLGGVYND